jgi:hypothetical protein
MSSNTFFDQFRTPHALSDILNSLEFLDNIDKEGYAERPGEYHRYTPLRALCFVERACAQRHGIDLDDNLSKSMMKDGVAEALVAILRDIIHQYPEVLNVNLIGRG